jgi:DNA-binding NarL/FixJ family response regulator
VESPVPGPSRRVVILYSHPLLGEGLAHLLGGDADLDIQLVRVDDLAAAEAALATAPDVVILERSLPLQAIDLLRVAPQALLIDVGLDAGPSWAYRREELSPQPDEILQTIRAGCHLPRTKGRRGAARVAIPVEPTVEVTTHS